MSKKATGIAKDISKSVQQLQNNGQLQNIINQEVETAIRKAVRDSLSFGPAKQALRKKIDDTLVTAINHYDINQDNISLDMMLQSVINQTVVQDRIKILSNFKNIMAKPPQNAISLKDLLTNYKHWVENTIEHDDLTDDAQTEDENELQISAEIIYEENTRFENITETAVILFTCDGELEDNDDFQKALRVWRFRYGQPWHIDKNIFASMTSLIHLDDFDTFALNSALANLEVTTDVDHLEETLTIYTEELN